MSKTKIKRNKTQGVSIIYTENIPDSKKNSAYSHKLEIFLESNRWKTIFFPNKRKLPKEPGVYILFNCRLNQVLYIGQSGNLYKRWNSQYSNMHHILKKDYILNSEQELDLYYLTVEGGVKFQIDIETKLIEFYKPPFNNLKNQENYNPDFGKKKGDTKLELVSIIKKN